MAIDFAKFKKTSSDTSRILKKLEEKNTKFAADARLWFPELDKAGNGQAKIRFLPAAAIDGDEGVPWEKVYTHSFKGPTGKWYIENCRTTIEQPDPCAEFNSFLWNSTNDDEAPARKQARLQKRKTNYYSNVLVLSDPRRPENDGKHFLYRYGQKVFEKIENLMQPEFEGDESVNPFDFWKGVDFRLRIKKKDGYSNYDDSKFESISTQVLDGDDTAIEALWKREYSLKEFIAPKNFKSYEELKARLNDVLGVDVDRIMKGGGTLPKASKATVEEEIIDEDGVVVDDITDADDELAKYRQLVE